jgi:tetratricopeptide (TPR) repeat protein
VRVESAPAVTGPLIDLLERALEALGDGESALRARVMARLANALALSAPERRRPELALQALDLVRRVGDRSELADVLTSSHHATWTPDNLDEQLAKARELGRVAAEVGDAGRVALASSWILTGLLDQGAIHETRRELAALNRAASTLPQPTTRYLAAVARARNAHLEGRLRDYEALAREVLADGVQGDDEHIAGVFGLQMLFLRREQGRLGELLGTLEGLTNRSAELPAWRCLLAWVYAELDRRPDAQRELEAVAGDDLSTVPRDWAWLSTMAILSEVVAFLHDSPRAKRLHELLLPYADRFLVVDGPFCLGSASRPLGLLATTVRRFDAAARHFEDALEMNRKIRSPLWIAHTQHDYAQTLLRRDHPGDRETALTLLDRALATADKLGLTALADRAQRLKHRTEAAPSV